MKMQCQNNWSLFVFGISFCFLCSFVRCSQINTNSTSNSNEDGEEIDANELTLFLLIYFAICIIVPVFLLLSVLYIIAGLAVSLQWPHPRCYCWTRPMNDSCCAGCRCSLFYANIIFAVIWLAFAAFTWFTYILALFAVSFVFGMSHVLAALSLYTQFKKYGWPRRQFSTVYPTYVAAAGQLFTRGDGYIVLV